MSDLFTGRRQYRSLGSAVRVETDPSRLPVLIRAAHAAIDARVEQLEDDHHASTGEPQAS